MVFEQNLSDFFNYDDLNESDAKAAQCLSFELRLESIARRQKESTSLFNRLQAIMDQIGQSCEPENNASAEEPPAVAPPKHAFLADHNYAFSHSSSGASSSSSTETASSTGPSVNEQSVTRATTSTDEQSVFRATSMSAKRKIFDDEYEDFSAEDDAASHSRDSRQNVAEEQYPQQVGDVVILGPNGTEIDTRSYTSIIWSSAASATRQLLGFVFSSDVLATHTLTGKPSPAFYGRERPAKMQLDPVKAADIIHCVKLKFNCTEREIRAAITTKCSDTSKKYKRRSQKQMESANKM